MSAVPDMAGREPARGFPLSAYAICLRGIVGREALRLLRLLRVFGKYAQ